MRRVGAARALEGRDRIGSGTSSSESSGDGHEAISAKLSARPPLGENDGANEGVENEASETNEASENVELMLADRRKDDLP